LTGTERWNRCGDTLFESRRSGRPLFKTLGAEAERLAMVGRHAGRSRPDKNGMTLAEIDHLGLSAKPSDMQFLSGRCAADLVAGNVTGGGGKATITKT